MQQEVWFHKYQILGLLGRGGTAKVYLAEHIKLNSYRVIKCISKKHPLYEQQRNEAFILKNLKHSCIPIIYDIEEDEEGSYIVEQYLEGETLKDYVMTRGCLRDDIIIQFGIQLCDLIHYLHSTYRPILYVDLKPDNIIVSGDTLKLIDFGSALYQDELHKEQQYAGTRGYAAPELYRRNKADERCDVYGIGMLLYYMATGELIQSKKMQFDNIDHAGDCGVYLKNIINHCLKFNPSQRYASVRRLSKDLSVVSQKSLFQKESKQTIVIAIAGAQHRIGTTHLALRLSNYAISKGLRCLYQEHNDSGDVHLMKSRFEEVDYQNGIYRIHKIPMSAYQKEHHPDTEGYQIVVKDYGCLTKDKLIDFMGCEAKLLVLGAKEWELEFSEKALSMVTEYKDIFYLFNFMDGIQFQKVMKSMNHRNSYRIPYEPNPFLKITSKNGEELFREVLSMIRSSILETTSK